MKFVSKTFSYYKAVMFLRIVVFVEKPDFFNTSELSLNLI